ncbi:MAG: glycosyltransferase family 4 protein [Rhodospirillales bacterium]
MKILFFSDNFPPETNAAATRVYERACYWAQWGHEVTVITCAPNFPHGRLFGGYRNRWHQTEEMAGLRVVRVKTYIAANKGVVRRTLDFLSYMVSGFAAGLFETKPDVIVSTSPQFFAAVAGWALGAVRRVPFVFELGDLWPESIAAVGAMRQSRLLRMVEKFELFLYRRSAAVAALTQAFKTNLVSRGIEAGKIAVVINGVDTWRYGPRPRDPELGETYGLKDRFVVGYVGTHGMAHGLQNVLNAAELLKEESNVRLLLAGAGAERDALIEEARMRGLGNVVFIPPQPKEAMPRIWSLCDVALVHLRDHPAFANVIPSKMFEAMAMSLPILLAVPDGEARRILEADKAGVWVAPENPQALADAVRRLSAEPEQYRALADAGLAAAPRHSREQQARDMLAVLDCAAAGRGAEAGSILSARMEKS